MGDAIVPLTTEEREILLALGEDESMAVVDAHIDVGPLLFDHESFLHMLAEDPQPQSQPQPQPSPPSPPSIIEGDAAAAKKARRREQVREASRRRRGKIKSQTAFLETRIRELHDQLDVLRVEPDEQQWAAQAAELNVDEVDAESERQAKIISRLRRELDRIRAEVGKPFPSSSSPFVTNSPVRLPHLPVLPPVDVAECHAAVRRAYQQLTGARTPPSGSKVNFCVSADWHAKLWAVNDGSRLHWVATQQHMVGRSEAGTIEPKLENPSTALEMSKPGLRERHAIPEKMKIEAAEPVTDLGVADAASATWNLLTSPDAACKVDPNVRSVRVLQRVTDDLVVLERVVSLSPHEPLRALRVLAFRLRDGQNLFLVGTTALPPTAVDECRGWLLTAGNGNWDATSVGYCDVGPSDALDGFANGVLSGLHLWKRAVLEGLQ